MCRIVVAPDKFKGTLTAAQAAGIMAGAVAEIYPCAKIDVVPMADGGEGTAGLIGRMRGYRREVKAVSDALMRSAEALVWFSHDGKSCVVDSSAVIGLGMIAPSVRTPWKSTSFGLGKVVKSLIDAGVEQIEIGIGGTATVDAGIGFLQGLGARVVTAGGELHRPVMACDLNSIKCIDAAPVLGMRDNIKGISDVDVPLYGIGNNPSMLMFASQKGVADDSMDVLSHAVKHLIEHVEWLPAGFLPAFECNYGGAGGGLGFALAGVLGCEVVSGAEMLVDECGIMNPHPALVLTGEGRFDRQSFAGKLTGTILKRCVEKNVECRIVAGCVEEGIDSKNVIDASGYPPQGELTYDAASLRLKEATLDVIRNLGF